MFSVIQVIENVDLRKSFFNSKSYSTINCPGLVKLLLVLISIIKGGGGHPGHRVMLGVNHCESPCRGIQYSTGSSSWCLGFLLRPLMVSQFITDVSFTPLSNHTLSSLAQTWTGLTCLQRGVPHLDSDSTFTDCTSLCWLCQSLLTDNAIQCLTDVNIDMYIKVCEFSIIKR